MLNPADTRPFARLRVRIERLAPDGVAPAPLHHLHLARIALLQGAATDVVHYGTAAVERWPWDQLEDLHGRLQRGDLLTSLWSCPAIRAAFEEKQATYARHAQIVAQAEDALSQGDLDIARELFAACAETALAGPRPAAALDEIQQRVGTCTLATGEGEVCLDRHDLEGAAGWLIQAQAACPRAPAVAALAERLAAAQADRSQAAALADEARCLLAEGRADQAAAGFRQALALAPDRADLEPLLSQAEAEAGRHGEAAELERRARSLSARDRLREAVQAAEQAVALLPESQALPALADQLRERLRAANLRRLHDSGLLAELARAALADGMPLSRQELRAELEAGVLWPVDLDQAVSLLASATDAARRTRAQALEAQARRALEGGALLAARRSLTELQQVDPSGPVLARLTSELQELQRRQAHFRQFGATASEPGIVRQ